MDGLPSSDGGVGVRLPEEGAGGTHALCLGGCVGSSVCDWYFLGLVIEEYLENYSLQHFINVEYCGLAVLVQILILKV